MQQTSKNHHQTNKCETDKNSQNPKDCQDEFGVSFYGYVLFSQYVMLFILFPVSFCFNSRNYREFHEANYFDGDKVVLNNQDYEPKQGDIVVIAENGTQLDTAIIKE